MNDVFNLVGLAYIMERKTAIIDDKKFVYYEPIDAVFGADIVFNVSDERFLILSGKYLGQTFKKGIRDNYNLVVRRFRTIANLLAANNNVLDLNVFRSWYTCNLNSFYTYNSKYDEFYKIEDKDIINKIKNNQNKEYDSSLLNSNSNIGNIYENIRKTIISQDNQIMQILTSLFKNRQAISLNLEERVVNKLKENLIIYGPTGTGKTEIINQIAKYYNVPMVIENAPDFTETGYIGRDITSMFNDLYLAADKDLEKAQKGILVIDEFDKLAEGKNSYHDHVSRIGVQRSLLKVLDGHTFYTDGLKFNTSQLTIILLGAFDNIKKDNEYDKLTTKDFVDYGIMRELMGRVSKYVAMNALSIDDLKKIFLESDLSPYKTYKALFDSMNIEITYDDGFTDYIARKAYELNSGARGLKTVFDNEIGGALFRIFAGDYSSIHLTMPESNGLAYKLIKK